MKRKERGLIRVRVLGVDGTGARMEGKPRAGLLFFVDVDRGKLICVETNNEKDSRKVKEHVLKVFAAVGAQELCTDELSVYEGIVDETEHEICLAHWRKSKLKRAYEIHRQLKIEGLDYAAKDMLELIALLRQDLCRRRYRKVLKSWCVDTLTAVAQRCGRSISCYSTLSERGTR